MEFEYDYIGSNYKICIARVDPAGSETEIIYPEGDYSVVAVRVINAQPNEYAPNITKVIIPEGVRRVWDCAFYGFNGLKEVILPSSLVAIGDSSFQNCETLESIVLPDVNFIGNYCFAHCFDLREINIPDSVLSIGTCAFWGTRLRKSGFFKGTKRDMSCSGHQYELGKSYHEDDIEMCEKGFHYVTNAFALLNYYWGDFGYRTRFFDVEPSGEILEDGFGLKSCCSDIKFLREYGSYAELLG